MNESVASRVRLATMDEHERPEGGFKEIFTSLTIAFAMALAFRGFVVEGFVIPTGSMAPTLLGMHMRFQSPETGESWSVGPWYYADLEHQIPKLRQGQSPDRPVSVGVPGTGSPLSGGAQSIRMTRSDVPRLSGDRIFVLKYLYQLFEPKRFDVLVFKNPTNPYENYIKRLIGLPGEQLALVDGDVFTRAIPADGAGGNPWEGDTWQIARKKERKQRDLWSVVFDSRYTPLGESSLSGAPAFVSPWSGEGWSFSGDGIYRQDSSLSRTLSWDSEGWPITDFVSYNDKARERAVLSTPRMDLARSTSVMATSDIRTLVSVRPDSDGLTATLRLRTRGHVFRARVGGGAAVLDMRSDVDGSPWREVDRREVGFALSPDRISTIEFWHVDQALYLFIDGRRVAGGAEDGAYDWSPAERIEFATGLSMDAIMKIPGVLFDASRYTRAELAWTFEGSALTVHRAGVWRDLYYQAATIPGRARVMPARATHPSTVVTLKKDQFFVCGDNSAKSQDSRLMSTIDPWVDHEFDPGSPGIIPRELVIGKAFFVYFPSLQWRGKIPVPDFGRMRFIR